MNFKYLIKSSVKRYSLQVEMTLLKMYFSNVSHVFELGLNRNVQEYSVPRLLYIQGKELQKLLLQGNTL